MLMVQSASNQRQIRDLEDRILYVLSSSRGNILEDETATKTLYSSKITSEGISVKQKEIQKSEQEIDQVRESYRAVASHAASLYSCIGQLRHLNKVYQFSLPWFINLFTNSTVTSQTSLLISERIVYVNEHFSRTLHHSICRALFNTDRQLFTVLLAFAALRSKGNVQQETIDRLYAETPLLPSHWIGPSWIDGKTWQHIMELSQTVERLKELPQHMECNAQEWQEFCLPSHLARNLPSPWHQLEPLEQLLIIKHLKPDCFAASVNTFIKAILGPNYSENIINDLQGAYEESKSTVPVLCFVAGNIDPCQSISSLCEKKLDNRNRIKSFTLGRGSDRTVYNLVRRCADEGNWAVVQNIHLYPDLVDEIVDQLRMEQKDFGNEFRLWLIGYASSQYSPMALQFCVKTVCESPSCFRDGLLEILRLDFVHDFSSARASSAESSFQSANPSQLEKENVIFRSEPWRRISLALFCFHALLLERTRYSTLGFAGLVEFTYYDLKSALILVKDSMLSARDISLASLRALVVDCVYRAQLTIENDVAILRRFIDHLLSSNILQADRY
ncbi:hypothetical protein OUZ56_014249 [Daphnia magna]|uniref:Uncharacterized protein n=1 Tax=Daphnia magna TaxID=35525 RepID=A0ABQ9Z8B5_9CRUS|nr:hypothetical protein OUZ56_014249 [Daphnia magna]